MPPVPTRHHPCPKASIISSRESGTVIVLGIGFVTGYEQVYLKNALLSRGKPAFFHDVWKLVGKVIRFLKMRLSLLIAVSDWALERQAKHSTSKHWNQSRHSTRPVSGCSGGACSPSGNFLQQQPSSQQRTLLATARARTQITSMISWDARVGYDTFNRHSQQGIDTLCLNHLPHLHHQTNPSPKIHQPAREGSSKAALHQSTILPPGVLLTRLRITRLRLPLRKGASPPQHGKRPASALHTRARMPGSGHGERPSAACGSHWAASWWPLE